MKQIKNSLGLVVQKKVKEFEDKWFVFSKYVCNEYETSDFVTKDVCYFNTKKDPYFYVWCHKDPLLMAEFKPKRIVYRNEASWYDKEFVNEFKNLAKLIKNEWVEKK